MYAARCEAFAVSSLFGSEAAVGTVRPVSLSPVVSQKMIISKCARGHMNTHW